MFDPLTYANFTCEHFGIQFAEWNSIQVGKLGELFVWNVWDKIDFQPI